MKDYAAKNGFVYVDYYSPMVNSEGGLKAELSPDGVHPNKAGYDLMAPLGGGRNRGGVKKAASVTGPFPNKIPNRPLLL